MLDTLCNMGCGNHGNVSMLKENRVCTHFILLDRVAQWLGRRISDQGVPGSIPGRCTFRCGLEQVTFTLLSTG